jgi:basic amino acid/polyamine antiporter, APA family
VWFALAVAAVASFFSILFTHYSHNTGETWYVVWGPILMSAVGGLLGISVYLAQRASMTKAERIRHALPRGLRGGTATPGDPAPA